MSFIVHKGHDYAVFPSAGTKKAAGDVSPTAVNLLHYLYLNVINSSVSLRGVGSGVNFGTPMGIKATTF